ncbi:MAG: ATP-binding protein [Prevotella sp.]|nr:ATP-binding protein [Prevotella sp.]
MATRLKSKSFQSNLLFSIGGIFVIFAVCFGAYQFKREKEYKIDIMHSRLQMYNYEMLQALGDSITSPTAFMRYMKQRNMRGLRMTIIDTNGKVILDSQQRDVAKMGNHLKREEIQEALRHGNGYDIKRASVYTHVTYFYSATYMPDKVSHVGDIIIRSAVPYSADITRSLQADNTYIYFTVALTILLGLVLYYNTSRIGRHIRYLREFAVKAEQGDTLDHELERQLPDDELGDISHTIITLYWRLRHSEEERIRIKRQLTQNAAHELKTPTASIHGYLESILANPDMPQEKRQHFLERCYAQSERMSKLLMDMATLTKLDEKEGMPQRQQRDTIVDVKGVIDSVLEDTALQLAERGIAAHVDVPEPLLVPGDHSLIYSLFRNLVDNAIAYAQGADRLDITSKTLDSDKEQFYEFTVSDNGQGVEPQHLGRIFERFYRVDKGRSRKLGGTGLGLAIVKNAAVTHHGTARAEMTPGGGLTIVFTLRC